MERWLVQGLIPAGSAVALMGQLHSGKAWLAEQLALSVASGHDFLGAFRVRPQHVILIDEDSGTASFKRRFHRLARGLNVNLEKVPLECYSRCGFLLYDSEKRGWLRSLIRQQRGAPLVIIDNLDRIMGGQDVGAVAANSPLAGFCHELRDAGCTLVMVHQTGAKREAHVEDWDMRKEARGFTFLIECFDLALAIFRAPTTSTEFVLKPIVRESGVRVTRPFSIALREDQGETWARLEALDEFPELKGTRPHDVLPQVVEPSG